MKNNDIPLSFDSEFYSQEYDKALTELKEISKFREESRENYEKWAEVFKKEREDKEKIRKEYVSFEEYSTAFNEALYDDIVIPEGYILDKYNSNVNAQAAAWDLIWETDKEEREKRYKAYEEKMKKEEIERERWQKYLRQAIERAMNQSFHIS